MQEEGGGRKCVRKRAESKRVSRNRIRDNRRFERSVHIQVTHISTFEPLLIGTGNETQEVEERTKDEGPRY